MTDTKYVTVPREPTQAQLDAMLAAAEALLISPTKKSMGSKESAHEMNAATYRAALTAAPPAASGRARELAWIEDRFGDEFATPAADQRYTVQALADGEWLALRNGERLNDEPEDVIYGTRAAGKAACQQHFNAYVRSLLAPTVDERAASSEPEMCPNCVTPWKCNGPHEFPAASSEAAKVDGIHTPATCRHPHCNCEHGCVADPAPTTADAGVTEAMVETFEAKFLECARTRPDSTLRDDIRAALVAALGAREGE